MALNRTDMCLGNFWATSDRLELASFTRPLYSDNFHVIATRTAGEERDESFFASFWSSLDVAIQPFDPVLWFLLIGRRF